MENQDKSQEKKDLPIITSYAVVQLNGGWSMLTIKTQGRKVLEANEHPCEWRSIAINKVTNTIKKTP